jgi:hypothetical protein
MLFACRRPTTLDRGTSHFPDGVSAAIDEERRQLFEGLGTMYEGYYVLTLTWFPALLAQRKFVELMFDDDAKAPDHKAHTMGLIEFFKRECVSIESRLSSAVDTDSGCAATGWSTRMDRKSRTMTSCAGCSSASPADESSGAVAEQPDVPGRAHRWAGTVDRRRAEGRPQVHPGRRHRRLPAGIDAGHA